MTHAFKKYSVRTLLILNTCLAPLCLSPAANAMPKGNLYLGLSGDLTNLSSSDTDTGWGGNARLGYRFMPNDMGAFRIEAEMGYHEANGDNSNASDTQYFTYMGNLYYDFNAIFPRTSQTWHISPYIGGGLGDAAISYGDNSFAHSFHHNSDEFAYQLMAGLSLVSNSMPNTDWTLGYRFLSANNNTNDLRSHNLELGVRFHF